MASGDLTTALNGIISHVATTTKCQVGARHLTEIRVPNQIVFVPVKETFLPPDGWRASKTGHNTPRILRVRAVQIDAHIFASAQKTGAPDPTAADSAQFDAGEEVLEDLINAIYAQGWSYTWDAAGVEWRRADGELQKVGVHLILGFEIRIAVPHVETTAHIHTAPITYQMDD